MFFANFIETLLSSTRSLLKHSTRHLENWNHSLYPAIQRILVVAALFQQAQALHIWILYSDKHFIPLSPSLTSQTRMNSIIKSSHSWKLLPIHETKFRETRHFCWFIAAIIEMKAGHSEERDFSKNSAYTFYKILSP